jgi:Na+-transporting methylmalonyl-CoA/oxaloacetate decarboxylase gamma subunit
MILCAQVQVCLDLIYPTNTCASLMQVAELIFLGVAFLLVVGFFAYHMWLISRATTTYETFKWREVARRQRAERMAEIADGEGQTPQSLSEAVKRPQSVWPSPRQPKLAIAVPRNMYDRGFVANFKDALVPPSWAVRFGAMQSKKKT